MSEVEVYANAGDVRLHCEDPLELAARLTIAQIIRATDLPDASYAEQRIRYPDPQALVPDPRTVRQCTPEEAAYYIKPLGGSTQANNDVILYLGNSIQNAPVFANGNTPEWFGYTMSVAEEITTTPTASDNLTIKEGMHIDSGAEYTHRLGYCVEGARQLLVATHSAWHILSEGGPIEVSSTRIRARLMENPALLRSIACLCVRLEQGEGYEAWTGSVLHDGSMGHVLQKENGQSPVSKIIFARL